MKKAQIAIQFNWIFIFIVGAIILAFFLVVIKSQTTESNAEVAAELINNLETIIKTSQQSKGSFKSLSLPTVTIGFTCEEDISFFELKESSYKKDNPFDIIFAPEEISGNNLFMWSLEWKLPYPVAHFQYLTNNRIKYVIIDDTSSFAEELNKTLPKNITKSFISSNEAVVDQNYDHYRIIYFDTKPTNINTPEKKTSYLNVTVSGTNIDSYGELEFFNGNKDSLGKNKFLKLESLLGAVFSNTEEFYNCTMKKAFERLNIINSVHNNRANNLSQSQIDSTCKILYLTTEQAILTTLELKDAHTIYINAQDIKKYNEDLMRGKNCPLIY
ncbi:MAG: hypothetical protein KKB65_01435 [Nanoarchaeota archaeon]|nr:hypothetical protein [Nanoarchaeota archaeon]MBU1029872.1 hypothetical protein [Nanoarchaeota archaeon]MBU1849278.1 hypothetical protein [Nanoarchaeota archaeon]